MKAGIAVRLRLAIAGVLAAGLASGLASGSALAQGPGGDRGPGFGEHRPPFEQAFGGGPEHGRWWNNPKLVERLKLTDEQRKSFDGILQAHREKLVDLRASLEKAELELEPLIKDDQPNEPKILSQIDKVAQARAELEKANARFLLAIRSKLTPEQWKQLQADREQHGPEGRRGPGPEGWRPGGPRRLGPDGPNHGQPPAAGQQPDPPQGAGPGAAPDAAPPGPQTSDEAGAAPDGPTHPGADQ